MDIKTIGRNKQKKIGISWQVQRQHSDFEWLRNMLVKMYPGIVIPALPSNIKDMSNQILMNSYILKLQKFLMDCQSCKQLKNSNYFQVFLSYTTLKDFENYKKSCESISKPKTLNNVINLKGQISLLYNQNMDIYANGLQTFLTKTSLHLKNVRKIVSQIDNMYTQVYQKYKQLSTLFQTMSNQSCQFSDQQCYPKLTKTYKQIAQITNKHSKLCISQKQFIQQFFDSHFSYQRDRVNNISSLIQKQRKFSQQFSKPKHQKQGAQQKTNTGMFSKISGLFGQKNQSLDIPSIDTSRLKQQVGFYNQQLLSQSIRCIDNMITSHINHFSFYGHSRIDNTQQQQRLWSSVLVDLSKLKV